MTIQEIIKDHNVAIEMLTIRTIDQCLDWKAWKSAELVFDSVMCYLEKLPELIALEDQEGYLENEVIDVIYDYTDSRVIAYGETINMTAEDLGL